MEINYYKNNKLDIYPGGENLLFFIHGGSWAKGCKEDWRAIGQFFANSGFTTIIPDYRKFPEVYFPEHLNDLLIAYKWARTHLEYKKAVLVGYSAGAHLGALMAFREEFAKVALISGIYLRNWLEVLDLDIIFKNCSIEESSPIHQIKETPAEFMIYYGEYDLPSLDIQAENFYSRLIEKNRASLNKVSEACHHETLFKLLNELVIFLS